MCFDLAVLVDGRLSDTCGQDLLRRNALIMRTVGGISLDALDLQADVLRQAKLRIDDGDEGGKFKHVNGLFLLCGLLIIYLTTVLRMADRPAFDIVGGFLALSYLTPVVGGLVADRWLGHRATTCVGAMSTTLGYICLAIFAATTAEFAQPRVLLLGLACVAAGNGFIKASVMTLVGRLYLPGDPRRDGGFSLGYAGMNVGQLLSAVVSSYAAYRLGWPYGFALLAFSSVLGLTIFITHLPALPRESEITRRLCVHWVSGAVTIIVTVVACDALLIQRAALGWILAVALIATAVYITRQSIAHGDQAGRASVRAATVLALFAAFAWVFVEQAAGSLNLFASRHLPTVFLHLSIAAPQYQSLNPIFLILLCPLAAMLWSRLGRTGRDPRPGVKFAGGFVLFAASFLALSGPALLSRTDTLSPWWLVLAYLLSAVGELLVSPIGLAAMSRVTVPHLSGAMMGFWYLSLSAGDYAAQRLGALTSVAQLSAVQSLANYGRVFMGFACIAVLAGAGLLLLPRRWVRL